MTEDPHTEREPDDQDSEPSLNAPGDTGPTGRADADRDETPTGDEHATDDQDAEPTQNAPGH